MLAARAVLGDTVPVLARSWSSLLLTVTLLGAGCSSSNTSDSTTSADSNDATTTHVLSYTPKWVDTRCTVKIPAGAKVTCGSLSVPEDRSIADGDMVVLPVVRIHSTSKSPKPDPVVYLHGGPGSGTLQRGLTNRVKNPVLAERDLIVFDQRGAGESTPSLECPEREKAFIDALASTGSFDDEQRAVGASLRTCHDRLIDEGRDLDQYNSLTNAADLADLRVALGIDEWNLWGVSYGTRLALTEMRSYPEGVRSVVIDSVYPPSSASVTEAVDGGIRAFEALANGCATDPVCHQKYPDVTADLETAAVALDAAPYSFSYTDPVTKKVTTLNLTGDDAAGGFFNALYDTDLIPQLPNWIHDLAAGGRSLIPLIAQDGIPFVNDITEGAYMSYECADNGARLSDDEVEKLRADPGRAGLLLLAGFNIFCDTWPVEHLPAEYGDVVESDIPTLVVAGEYDPITPPAGSRAVAEALADSVFIQVPRGGHGPALTNGCTSEIYTEFFSVGTAVDTSCLDSFTPLPFT